MEEIRADMVTYESAFDVNIIPHISENKEIVDNIHNYPKRCVLADPPSKPTLDTVGSEGMPQTTMSAGK